MEDFMANTYYLCTDIDAYNYTCKFYKDSNTEIIRCATDDEFFSSLDIILENLGKLFYFFGRRGKGYLKAEMGKIENIDDDFKVFVIPNPKDINKETNKPKEIRIADSKRCFKVFSRIDKKK